MISETIEFALEHWIEILAIISTLIAAANIIARYTPTQKDDVFLERMRRVLEVIGSLGIPNRVKKIKRARKRK